MTQNTGTIDNNSNLAALVPAAQVASFPMPQQVRMMARIGGFACVHALLAGMFCFAESYRQPHFQWHLLCSSNTARTHVLVRGYESYGIYD